MYIEQPALQHAFSVVYTVLFLGHPTAGSEVDAARQILHTTWKVSQAFALNLVVIAPELPD